MKALLCTLAVVACSKSGGSPAPVATLDGDVLALTADDSTLYVALMKLGRASIVRMPKTGGPAQPMIAKTGVANGLAVAGGTLYWCEIAIEDTAPGSGMTVISGDEVKRAGGVGDAVVAHDRATTSHFGRIMAAAVDGTAAHELAHFDGIPSGLAIDDRAIYVLSVGSWDAGSDLDPTRGSIVSLPIAGGAVTVLADHLERASALTLDAASVYWKSHGVAYRVPKAGGAPQQATAMPASAYSDDPFEKAAVVGKTRYRATNKDSHATIVAEPI